MGKKSKVIVGLGGVLIVVAIAAFFFFRYQIRKSFPQMEGTVTLAGIEHSVQIVRDRYGIPRIEAENEHDLMFALGYVHAQDRLWEMDMGRRIGEGRLSELFGFVTLPFDRMFRIVGIRSISEKIEESLTSESRNRLQWYADGVNAFMNTHKGKYPVEFDMLRYDPEEWKPVHSIIIGRLMAWELNLSWWTDLTYGAIAERVGLEKALDIFPPFPPEVPPAVPADAWKKYAGLTADFLKTAQSFAALKGPAGILGGSNAWVVAPRKSASGKVDAKTYFTAGDFQGANIENETFAIQFGGGARFWFNDHLSLAPTFMGMYGHTDTDFNQAQQAGTLSLDADTWTVRPAGDLQYVWTLGRTIFTLSSDFAYFHTESFETSMSGFQIRGNSEVWKNMLDVDIPLGKELLGHELRTGGYFSRSELYDDVKQGLNTTHIYEAHGRLVLDFLGKLWKVQWIGIGGSYFWGTGFTGWSVGGDIAFRF